MIAGKQQRQVRSRRKLVRWAIATLLIGLLPIISNLLVEGIAPSLNCLVIEHGAYTKGASFAADRGDLIPGCYVGGVEVGSVLHAMHMFIIAIFYTWPIVIISLILWLALLFVRWPHDSA